VTKDTAAKGQKDIFAQQREYANTEDSLERIVPFSSVIADGIVCTKNGDFVRSWRMTGMSFEGLSDEEIYSRMEGLNLFIRAHATGKFAFWVHRIRRYTSDSLAVPEYNDFTRSLVAQYYKNLSDQGMMSTEFYLTVIYRPYPQGRGGVFGKLHRSLKEIHAEIESAVEKIETASKAVTASLEKYRPELLGEYVFAGRTFSTQLEFYAYLINGFWWRIPVKNLPLYKYLPVSRLLFGNDMIECRNTYGTEYSCFLELKDYSDYTAPGILNTLLSLDCEYVETHSFSPMTTLDAQSALKKQHNQMISSEDNAISQIKEIDLAIDSVISGDFVLGEYHYTLLVKGATPNAAREFRSNAAELLNRSNFLGVNLEKITASAYAAQLPCNWKARPREARISSRNFTGMCSFHTFDSGKRDGNP
jgi:type IV secretion system protein VirB4